MKGVSATLQQAAAPVLREVWDPDLKLDYLLDSVSGPGQSPRSDGMKENRNGFPAGLHAVSKFISRQPTT